MANRIQTACILLAGLWLLALPTAAQITVGDDLNLTATGTINAGYNDVYGNQIESSHSLAVGGSASLNGYFYNPNFLNFSVSPYYNQSRANSGSGSITDASGVNLTSSIFGGSHTPGSVNYAAAFNSTGNYGIPGITSLNTNGNNQTFGINWGIFEPGYPTLSAGFQMGNSNYSLYGTNENGGANFKSFNIDSSYTLAGFGLSAAVIHGTSNSLIPGVILGGETATADSDSTSYVFSASHQLPWNGNFNTSFNRTDLNSDYLGYTFNGDIDVVTTNFSFHPTPKLSFTLGGGYTDNLSGSLYEAIVPGAGGGTLASTSTSGSSSGSTQSTTNSTGVTGVVDSTSEESSHALNILFNTTYSFAANLQAQGFIERRQQTFLGASYGSNLYDGGVYYTRQIAGGYMGVAGNIFDSTVDTSSENALGFNVNLNYGRRIGAWSVAGYLSYAQNVQTLLVTYNASQYSFSGNIGRRIGTSWYWTAAGSGGRTGIPAVAGSTNSSESFGTTFGMKRLGFGASYAKSSGNSLAGGGGLVPTPLPPIIPSNLLVLYGGTNYGASISTSPKRNMNASFSYVKSRNNLDNLGVTSWNNFEQENAYFQYQFRQLGVNGGYTRLVQGFSASGVAPASVSSVYIGVYRWFNFF